MQNDKLMLCQEDFETFDMIEIKGGANPKNDKPIQVQVSTVCNTAPVYAGYCPTNTGNCVAGCSCKP